MIDIHSHILYDMDDGAKTIDESARLCSLGKINGIKKIVVTPHFNALGDVDNFLKIRDEKCEQLKKMLEKNATAVELYGGAEVFVDDDVFFSKDLRRLTINNSRYLLIEFSFFGVRFKDIVGYLEELYNMGVVPIVAHPERYDFFQRDYDAVNELASRGVLFQLNAASLASRDGREEFELAYEMAYKGVAAFIGTDAHSIYGRANDIREMLRLFPQDIDPNLMERMLVRNPQRVLNNEDIPILRFKRLEKRKFY